MEAIAFTFYHHGTFEKHGPCRFGGYGNVDEKKSERIFDNLRRGDQAHKEAA